jgi:hypothetical protein
MQEEKERFPLSAYEVVLLIIAIPIIFYYLDKMFWTLGESWGSWWLRWFFSGFGYLLEKPWNPKGPLSILGFDCIWIIAMIYVPLKNLRIKIYSTLLIFIISVVFLTIWIQGNILRGWTL